MKKTSLLVLLAAAVAAFAVYAGSTNDDWNVGGNLSVTGTSTFTGAVSMTGVIQGPNGTAAAPAFTFSSDTDTGVYRVGANNLGFSAGGTLRLDLDGTDLVSTVPWRGPDGTAAAPAFSFSGDTNTGIYRDGSDTLMFSTAGNGQFQLNSAGQWLSQVGTNASAPAFSFTTDADTGIFRDTANNLAISTGGTKRFDIDSTDLVLTVPVRTADGSAAAPAYSFSSDTNSGMYSGGADSLLLGTGGNGHFQLNSAGQWMSQVGATAAAPALSFTTDTDTGIYRDTANTLQFATGGTKRAALDSNGLTLPSLTATRVTYAGTGGLLSDNSGFTFDGNTLSVPQVVRTGKSGSGTGGNLRCVDDGGTLRWIVGHLGGAGARNFSIYDNGASAEAISIATGTSAVTLIGGLVMGAPTGGDKGAGTINVATEIYKNNSAYTNPDYVFERAYTGKIEKYKNRAGAASYKPRTIEETEAYARRYHRFPGVKDTAMGVFERSDFVLERLEEQFLYIARLNQENKELKRRLAALEKAR